MFSWNIVFKIKMKKLGKELVREEMYVNGQFESATESLKTVYSSKDEELVYWLGYRTIVRENGKAILRIYSKKGIGYSGADFLKKLHDEHRTVVILSGN
jgi:hypothetical protein